jgi:hypothetical protein
MRDGRQSFSPEPIRSHRHQILKVPQLRGREPLSEDREVSMLPQPHEAARSAYMRQVMRPSKSGMHTRMPQPSSCI